MPKTPASDAKKREKIQIHFWNQVGSQEHISLPMLEDAVKKEFTTTNDRFIQTQVNLMQTEARIRIQTRVKVWIKQPSTQNHRDYSLEDAGSASA
jgi:hypothetical protein